MTSDLMTRGGDLVSITPDTAGVDRIAARITNIELLCNAVHREILLLGKELSDCKWSGDYLLDPKWNDPENSGKSRSWEEWLKLRSFVLRNGQSDTRIDFRNAATLMAYSSCYATLAAENRKREAQGLLSLPLPTNHSQIEPFQAFFDRADDWSAEDEWPDDVKEVAHSNAIRDTQSPYAEEQPRFLAKWQEICATLPVEKRQTPDGLMAPPPRNFSRNYLTREREIARKQKEAEDAKDKPADDQGTTLTVNSSKQSDQTKSTGTSTGLPKPPKKSKEQLEAEAYEAALRKDIQDYRNDLHNLRVSADAVESRLKSILARSGDRRLAEMRARTDLGIYSVHDDLGLLRGAVETCQRIYRLATEPYVPPTPMPRSADVASDQVIDV